MLLGAPGGSYTPLTAAVALGVQAVADLDGDGRLDIVGVGGNGQPARAVGRGTKSYHWQVLRPRAATATGDQRINSFGIGGEIELRSALHAQKQIITSPLVHFGLGEATGADVVRITWPNGALQAEFDTKADQAVAATQRLKGSCPWLFAWNGHAMSFVTDLLWRSPLGLRINAQATADVLMTEDWVKVRGDQLAPRDGAYDLRVTAELWETHFFDLVSLLVVDHPGGHGDLPGRALRGASAETRASSLPSGSSRSPPCGTIVGMTCRISRRSVTTATWTSRAAARIRASRALTSSR